MATGAKKHGLIALGAKGEGGYGPWVLRAMAQWLVGHFKRFFKLKLYGLKAEFLS